MCGMEWIGYRSRAVVRNAARRLCRLASLGACLRRPMDSRRSESVDVFDRISSEDAGGEDSGRGVGVAEGRAEWCREGKAKTGWSRAC